MKSTDEASSGIVEPDVPDFARRHRHVDRLLDALDELDQVFDLLLAAVDGLVADDDTVDVAVALGEVDRRIISRSLRSEFLSIQAPTVTLRPNSAAIGGTSSTPPVEE